LDKVMQHIVKRAGHTEKYDERKLYASVYSASLAVRVPDTTAELVADKVTADVNRWLEKKHEVTSDDLRRKVSEFLDFYNHDAAYIFKHQRNLGR